jgi:hypothetical protein
MSSRNLKTRYIVQVTNPMQEEAYIGTFTDRERAYDLALRINEGIPWRNDGNAYGWARVIPLSPNPGMRSLVEWATGTIRRDGEPISNRR